jgi:hypothetical protein
MCCCLLLLLLLLLLFHSFFEKQSSHLLKMVMRSNWLFQAVVPETALVLPGSPAAMEMALTCGWEWKDELFWSFGLQKEKKENLFFLSILNLERKGYCAQCFAIGTREDLAHHASESLLELVKSKQHFHQIHPATVLCLMQRVAGFEDELRKRVKIYGCSILCGNGDSAQLRAWLLSHLNVNAADPLLEMTEFVQACFSWRLLRASDKSRVAKADWRGHGFVWRPHTHPFCPAPMKSQALFVLWVLKQAFPAASRRLREHLVEYAMSAHWFERPLADAPAPLVNPLAPHEILAPLAQPPEPKRPSKLRGVVTNHSGLMVAAVLGVGLLGAFLIAKMNSNKEL